MTLPANQKGCRFKSNQEVGRTQRPKLATMPPASLGSENQEKMQKFTRGQRGYPLDSGLKLDMCIQLVSKKICY